MLVRDGLGLTYQHKDSLKGSYAGIFNDVSYQNL